jgi:hypothetical protein
MRRLLAAGIPSKDDQIEIPDQCSAEISRAK